jgi:hypothetical protein
MAKLKTRTAASSGSGEGLGVKRQLCKNIERTVVWMCESETFDQVNKNDRWILWLEYGRNLHVERFGLKDSSDGETNMVMLSENDQEYQMASWIMDKTKDLDIDIAGSLQHAISRKSYRDLLAAYKQHVKHTKDNAHVIRPGTRRSSNPDNHRNESALEAQVRGRLGKCRSKSWNKGKYSR